MKKALGMQERAGGMTAVLSENLSAPREIRAFNLEDRESKGSGSLPGNSSRPG